MLQVAWLCMGSFFRIGSVTIWGLRAGDAGCAGIKPRGLEGRKKIFETLRSTKLRQLSFIFCISEVMGELGGKNTHGGMLITKA